MPILGTIASGISGHLTPPAVASFDALYSWNNNNGSTQTVDFTSISQSYRHLQLRLQVQQNAGQGILIRFNGDTGSNYGNYWINAATGSKSAGDVWINPFPQSVPDPTSNSTEYAFAIVDIHDYAQTDKIKTVYCRQSQLRASGGRGNSYSGHFWSSLSAITSIQLVQNNPAFNFTQYSQATVYGIKG